MNHIKSLPRSEKLARVGLYDLEKILGKGNFATVRLGKHRLTGSTVAVKVVDKKELDPANLDKIQREIMILRKLSHENIIQLYQVMETEHFIHIVTEYAATGELFDFIIENGKLSEQEAASKFSQILKAIHHCHQNKVVHRDLKAENLLLDQRGTIKLADFGFSNYFTPGETLATWCGSPPYAAPELFEGKPYDGQKADIWSLGVILYILVSGSLPFDGQTLQELRSRIVSCQFRIPFYISENCEDLIKSLLVLEPEQRISVEMIAQHSWLGSMLDYSTKQSFLAEICHSASSPLVVQQDEHLIDQVALLAGGGTTSSQVRASVLSNNCDHLSAMYHMLLCNRRDEISASINTSEEVDNIVTEVFEENEEQQLNKCSNSTSIQNGRRHTLGFPEYQMQLEEPSFSSKKYEDVSHLSYISKITFPASQISTIYNGIKMSSDFEMGRRASECRAHSKMTDNLLGRQNQFRNVEYLTGANKQNESDQRPPRPKTSPLILPPRKRRTGLRTVTDKPPNIQPELKLEVENRIYCQQSTSPLPPSILAGSPLSPSSSSSLSPSPFSSPSKLNLRQRRSGLSVVTEGKQTCRRGLSLKEPYSMNLHSDRHSPIRRLSDANHPSKSDCSLSELRTLQTEYKQEKLAFDFSPANVSQHQYLQLPSSPLLYDQVMSGREDLMAEMYQEMYPVERHGKHCRSLSVPTSPSIPPEPNRERHSLTHHLQELSLYQPQAESSDLMNKFLHSKGSITKGVPSLSAINPCPTPPHTAHSTPMHQQRPYLSGQTTHLPDLIHDDHYQSDGCPVIKVTDDHGDKVGMQYDQDDEEGQSSATQCANMCQ